MGCPKAWPITESCFQATPMPFAGNSSVFMVDEGKRLEIQSVFVSEGTQPHGSMWQMNPIPYALTHRNWDENHLPEFEPPFNGTGCAGNWPMTTIYDQLRVPAYLEPGEYVLGLRYDCEKSAQIWQSCADITRQAAMESTPTHGVSWQRTARWCDGECQHTLAIVRTPWLRDEHAVCLDFRGRLFKMQHC